MFRFFEILPGLLAWATLAGMVLFSWKLPAAVAIFIILFDIYWLLKTIYLSLHLRSTFKHMQANLRVNWLAKLQALDPTHYAPLDTAQAKPRTTHSWKDICHLIIFPMYTEPLSVVRGSFESLVK